MKSTDRKHKTLQDEPKTNKRLTDLEWSEVAAYWAVGDTTLEELSRRFGVTVPTISRKMKDLGVQKGQEVRGHMEAVADVIKQESMADARETARRIRETKDETYAAIRNLQRASMTLAAKAARFEPSSGSEFGKMAMMLEDQKALKLAMDIQKAGLDARWKLLQVEKVQEEEKEDDLPELTIRDMTRDEVEEIKREAEYRSGGTHIDVLEGFEEDEDFEEEGDDDLDGLLDGLED